MVGSLLALSAVGSAASAEGVHAHAFAGGHAGGHVGFHGAAGFHAPAHSFSGSRFHAGAGFHSGVVAGGIAARAPHSAYVTRYSNSRFVGSRYAARPSYAYSPTWHHQYWRGGYWRGAYWPRAYYYAGFPWFLAALPIGCTTFWFDTVPYYYVNDVYYTWSSDDNGYVVTDPPPAANSSTEANGDTASGKVYAYPTNGQNEQQQATDQQQCRDWASDQVGNESTTSGNAPVNSADYRRAVVACLEGRGYSAK